MSNKCPHCGAASGKSHEPCPYGPGGKFSKPRPASRLTAEEVKAVSAKALEQAPKRPLPKTVEIVKTPVGTFIHETAPIPEEAIAQFVAKRPEGRHESAQPLKLGVDDEDEAPVERKAKTAELQAKVSTVAADGEAASHPDCPRCAQVREQTRDRVRRAREKKAEEKKP